MKRNVLILAAACALTVASAFAQPRPSATLPATTQSRIEEFRDLKRRQIQEYLPPLLAMPELKLPTNSLEDIVAISIEDDALVVRPKLAPTDGLMRCSVKGFVGPCTVQVGSDKTDPRPAPTSIQFVHRDFGHEDEMFRHTILFAHADAVHLTMDLDGLRQGRSVSLIQEFQPDDPRSAVRLDAQLIDSATEQTIATYRIAASSFRELRMRFPAETEELLVPILRDLHMQRILAPEPRIVHQLFSDHPPADAALLKKIDVALSLLDSDDFQERQQSSEALSALGEPAAMALAHMSRKDWSIERGSRVDAFLLQYKFLSADQSKSLLGSPIFLLDCLYSDEEQIRISALKSLDRIASRPLNIDPLPADDRRDQMIDTVFARFYPPLATHP